jgi:hypothetical protein
MHAACALAGGSAITFSGAWALSRHHSSSSSSTPASRRLGTALEVGLLSADTKSTVLPASRPERMCSAPSWPARSLGVAGCRGRAADGRRRGDRRVVASRAYAVLGDRLAERRHRRRSGRTVGSHRAPALSRRRDHSRQPGCAGRGLRRGLAACCSVSSCGPASPSYIGSVLWYTRGSRGVARILAGAARLVARGVSELADLRSIPCARTRRPRAPCSRASSSAAQRRRAPSGARPRPARSPSATDVLRSTPSSTWACSCRLPNGRLLRAERATAPGALYLSSAIFERRSPQ